VGIGIKASITLLGDKMKFVSAMGINAPQQLVQKSRIVLFSFPWANYLTPNYYMHGVIDEETHVCFSWDAEPTLELVTIH
jgi:hypothetical protein